MSICIEKIEPILKIFKLYEITCIKYAIQQKLALNDIQKNFIGHLFQSSNIANVINAHYPSREAFDKLDELFCKNQQNLILDSSILDNYKLFRRVFEACKDYFEDNQKRIFGKANITILSHQKIFAITILSHFAEEGLNSSYESQASYNSGIEFFVESLCKDEEIKKSRSNDESYITCQSTLLSIINYKKELVQKKQETEKISQLFEQVKITITMVKNTIFNINSYTLPLLTNKTRMNTLVLEPIYHNQTVGYTKETIELANDPLVKKIYGKQEQEYKDNYEEIYRSGDNYFMGIEHSLFNEKLNEKKSMLRNYNKSLLNQLEKESHKAASEYCKSHTSYVEQGHFHSALNEKNYILYRLNGIQKLNLQRIFHARDQLIILVIELSELYDFISINRFNTINLISWLLNPYLNKIEKATIRLELYVRVFDEDLNEIYKNRNKRAGCLNFSFLFDKSEPWESIYIDQNLLNDLNKNIQLLYKNLADLVFKTQIDYSDSIEEFHEKLKNIMARREVLLNIEEEAEGLSKIENLNYNGPRQLNL